ncbi:MAG: DUF1311 domain-containing protein [Candidatus Aminicenantes bacterium]|nr:DUF1311 domain-containing protein [Candidatus Aminicenantes bacterium]
MRFRPIAAAGLICLALASGPYLRPQDAPKKHPIDQWLSECMEKDPSTQGMLLCLDEAYRRWDAELNRVYQDLMSRLTPDERAALRESQRAWLKQRDEMFKLLDAIYGRKEGTMFLTMRAADRVEIVQKRALELLGVLDVLNIE